MAGSVWSHEAVFDGDPAAALAAIKAEVWEAQDFQGAELGCSTPEEVFEATFPEGTCSPLDLVVGVSDVPRGLAASPLGDDELRGIFGAATVSMSTVDSAQIERIGEALDNGQARYFVALTDSGPRIVFVGRGLD